MKRLLFAAVFLVVSVQVQGQDEKWREVLARPAPTTGGAEALSQAYLERAAAARALNDPDRELAELEAGVKAIGPEGGSVPLRMRLIVTYSDRGANLKAVQENEALLKVAQAHG